MDKKTEATIKFYDSTAIPTEYYGIIDSAVQWCKDTYPNYYGQLFKAINDKAKLSEINSLMHGVAKSTNDYQALSAVINTLYCCANKNLRPVCDTYSILKGHLSYSDENNVYQIISSYALNAISDNPSSLHYDATLSGDA